MLRTPLAAIQRESMCATLVKQSTPDAYNARSTFSIRLVARPQATQVLDAIGVDSNKQIQRGVSPRRFTASEGAGTMSNNIYVGNLAFDTTTNDLEALFAEHGEVKKAQVITDRDSGRSRGFGFVEMASSEAAKAAIASLDGSSVDGRNLTVNVAKERSR